MKKSLFLLIACLIICGCNTTPNKNTISNIKKFDVPYGYNDWFYFGNPNGKGAK